ncbi:urocanate hydratase [Desulfopila inferna]|uniref:urocanate hydratase n=1 Tax=Desulfopila inferna TaxID=468528 RepID=UPI001F063D17|nr:urocanate hydratase [Desulfopila inferna]
MTPATPEGCMKICLDDDLPEKPAFAEGIRRAPDRGFRLSRKQTEISLRNALRYIPKKHHALLLPEFLEELRTRGRIYGYRFRPTEPIKARPVDHYRGNCLAGRSFQLMIDNNLDFDVALYPYELVTYGETGSVCQNWMQYRLIKKYLQELRETQTLVMQSGHPLGLFRSGPGSPRVIITNGLMVGLYDNQDDWEIAAQMGVTSYGQMTAGGWMYIGPQGIVHGTYTTLLGAGRRMCGIAADGNLAGLLFVSSGLGGMSGAQPKAAKIAGAVSIIAEVDLSRIETRYKQGWVDIVTSSLQEAVSLAERARQNRDNTSIAYHGNVVDLLEYLAGNNVKVELLSDQTSCHVVYDGGYCPQGVSFAERTRLLAEDRGKFITLVKQSLARHIAAVDKLSEQGTYFFDYGNAFLKAVFDAGITEVSRNGIDDKEGFIYPSYFEDIMGPIFDYGYGPFRWICLSGDGRDLERTDRAALSCLDPERRAEDRDNFIWIQNAADNNLVVGSQARILYADAAGRMTIALKFNAMVREKEIGPIMLGRDHHDPGGTDSPFRETANIADGSNVCADMATQCFAGNAARGMTLVALHNGGGTGIGKAINGGFGLVLDGSSAIDDVIRSAMNWDVMGGVARRNWSRNPNAMEVAAQYNLENSNGDQITIPALVDDELLAETMKKITFSDYP